MRKFIVRLCAALMLIVALSGCDWRFAVWREFHDTGQEQKAYCIVQRESGGNPHARNRSGASGLFQIMLPLHDRLFTSLGYVGWRDWHNPFANAAVARALWNGSGWAPWAGGNYAC